jgi:hypothetical protein
MDTKLWTWAGKLRKLVSSPIKPCINTSSRRRRPDRSSSGGTSDWVDDERGSFEAIAVRDGSGTALELSTWLGGCRGGRGDVLRVLLSMASYAGGGDVIVGRCR